MLCAVSGRQYIELKVIQPSAYRGWMRLYVDRIDEVEADGQFGSVVVWRRTAALDESGKEILWVQQHCKTILRLLERCGWRERRPGEPAGLLQ